MGNSANVPQGQDQSTKSVPCGDDVMTNQYGDTYSVPDQRPACAAYQQPSKSPAAAYPAGPGAFSQAPPAKPKGQ